MFLAILEQGFFCGFSSAIKLYLMNYWWLLADEFWNCLLDISELKKLWIISADEKQEKSDLADLFRQKNDDDLCNAWILMPHLWHRWLIHINHLCHKCGVKRKTSSTTWSIAVTFCTRIWIRGLDLEFNSYIKWLVWQD